MRGITIFSLPKNQQGSFNNLWRAGGAIVASEPRPGRAGIREFFRGPQLLLVQNGEAILMMDGVDVKLGKNHDFNVAVIAEGYAGVIRSLSEKTRVRCLRDPHLIRTALLPETKAPWKLPPSNKKRKR